MGVWKEIRKEGDMVFSHAIFSLGNDRRLCFQKDVWCGKEASCDSFPLLFVMAAEGLMAEV